MNVCHPYDSHIISRWHTNNIVIAYFLIYLANDDIGGGASEGEDTDGDRGGKDGISFLAPGVATCVQINGEGNSIDIIGSITVLNNMQD